jgi:hypothetical protein
MAEPAPDPVAVVPNSQAAVAPPRPAVGIGLVPTTLDEAWRLAQYMAKSDLVPKAYKGKPEDVLVAMMYGAELGLTPAQAMTGISVINGRPGLFGEALLGVIVASPLYETYHEYYNVTADDGLVRITPALTADDLKRPTTTAVCKFWRRGRPDPIVAQFSIADAQRARLTGKAGPWIEYPQIMLKMRARGFAARDAFPDLLRGIRTAEELRDTPARDLEIEPAPVVHRLSERPPAPEVWTLEPARVELLAPFLDQGLLTLSSGARIVVPSLEDVHALQQYIGTPQLVAATVTRGATDELVLQSFTLTD